MKTYQDGLQEAYSKSIEIIEGWIKDAKSDEVKQSLQAAAADIAFAQQGASEVR